MASKSLSRTVFQTYRDIDDIIITVKSTVLGLCSDIDRFFKFKLNIETNKKISEENLDQLYESFPLLKGLDLEQINRLIFLFSAIRNVNAHLYLNKRLYLDDDLLEYFERIYRPLYPIVYGKELTMYGMVYVLSFLSQKHMHWEFITHFFRYEYFVEVKKKGLQEYHQKILKSFMITSGIGTPIFGNAVEGKTKQDFLFLNDMNRRYLTNIFFDFEKALLRTNTTRSYAPSFRTLLESDPLISMDEEFVNLILKIRNCWFHGYQFFDLISDYDVPFVFDFDFLLDALIKVKSICMDNPKFSIICDDIQDYGKSFILYYAQRMVELSYKILDKRIFNEEKIDTRIAKMLASLEKFLSIDKRIYEKADSLISDPEISWSMSKSNFSDFVTRTTICKNLSICKLHSDNGFYINNHFVNQNDIVIIWIDLETNNQCKINGKYLEEYSINNMVQYGKHVSIAELK